MTANVSYNSAVRQRGTAARLGRQTCRTALLGCGALAMLLLLAGPLPRAARCQEPAAVESKEESFRPEVVLGLLELVIDADPDSAARMLKVFRAKIRSGELSGARLEAIRPNLAKLLAPIRRAGAEHPLHWETLLLAATWGDANAQAEMLRIAQDPARAAADRSAAVDVLVSADHAAGNAAALELLSDNRLSPEIHAAVLAALSESHREELAAALLVRWESFAPELKPKVLELLTQRPAWSRVLLDEIQQGRMAPSSLNANQVVRLQQSPDEALRMRTREIWGVVRTERNAEREQVIARVRRLLAERAGDPEHGASVFRRVCSQCHRMHGEGQEVGPDLTQNGRSSLEQLLSNVLDPSLVIGAAYQARLVITTDGRVLTGLPVEESDERLVLRLQGGKLETIPAADIEQIEISKLSMMPEGLEQQIAEQELVDLFAYLLRSDPPR